MKRTLSDETTSQLLDGYHSGMQRLTKKRLLKAAQESNLSITPEQAEEIAKELHFRHKRTDKKLLNLPV